jgi:hypothetical protein
VDGRGVCFELAGKESGVVRFEETHPNDKNKDVVWMGHGAFSGKPEQGKAPGLVAKRLACLERMGDAFLRLALAGKAQEGLALKVEEILFADE